MGASRRGSFSKGIDRAELVWTQPSVFLGIRINRGEALPISVYGKRHCELARVLMLRNDLSECVTPAWTVAANRECVWAGVTTVRNSIRERMTSPAAINLTILVSPGSSCIKPGVPGPTVDIAKAWGHKPQHSISGFIDAKRVNFRSSPVQTCGKEWQFAHRRLRQSPRILSVSTDRLARPTGGEGLARVRATRAMAGVAPTNRPLILRSSDGSQGGSCAGHLLYETNTHLVAWVGLGPIHWEVREWGTGDRTCQSY